MQILLLESNPSLSQFINKALCNEAFQCHSFSSIASLLLFLKLKPPIVFDAAVIEPSFLDKNHRDLISTLTKQWSHLKIIGLTDQPGSKERIKMLELGCHDCLTKPIDIKELILRLKISCQRNQIIHLDLIKENWNIQINEDSKCVIVRDDPIKLTQKEYLLMENFYFHPEKIFSRTLLLDLAWDNHKESESNVVEATISGLRKKLIEKNANVVIKSRRHLGYWLESC